MKGSLTFITFVTCINRITCITCINWNVWLLVVLVYLYYIYFHTDLKFSLSRISHQILSWDIIDIAGCSDRLCHRDIMLHELNALLVLPMLVFLHILFGFTELLKIWTIFCQWPNCFLSVTRLFSVRDVITSSIQEMLAHLKTSSGWFINLYTS